MSSEDGSEIDSTGTLRSVESPHSLWVLRIHVHRLGTIAPARCHGDGGADTLALKLFGASCALTHPSDGGVADDTFHWTAVAISQICFNKILNGLGEVHSLFLEALADTALTPIDSWADTDFWIHIDDDLFIDFFR
jgi:hypothetical protein